MRHQPIIGSLLDTDFYKFTMAQAAWRHHRDVDVTFGFTNRTKDVRIADTVPLHDLLAELDAVRGLRFTEGEIAYMRDLGTFDKAFLGFLMDIELPAVDVRQAGGGYTISTTGPWPVVTFWETIVLSIVNELHYRGVLSSRAETEGIPYDEIRERVRLEGCRRFREKVTLLQAHPDIRFAEFGTRRRYSREWQDYIVTALSSKWPCGVPEEIIGTSNVYLAKKIGIKPVGTFAHEMFMVYAGIYGGGDWGLRDSHNMVLRDWWYEYGEPLSIALTDTFGSEFFFRDMSESQARGWRGVRHDSGDPFEFAEKTIAFYGHHGIDPRTKTIVFSDGLDPSKVIALHKAFTGRIGVAFGWGTNLTNDLGEKALSLVMKAVAVNGVPTVKLSDNPAKAMGPKADIARYQRVFSHETGTFEECRY